MRLTERDEKAETASHPDFDLTAWIKAHASVFWPALVGILLAIAAICLACLYRLRMLRRQQDEHIWRRHRPPPTASNSTPGGRQGRRGKSEWKSGSNSEAGTGAGAQLPRQAATVVLVTSPLLPLARGHAHGHGPARSPPTPSPTPTYQPVDSSPPPHPPGSPLHPRPSLSQYVPTSRGPLPLLHPLRMPLGGLGAPTISAGPGVPVSSPSDRSERTSGPTPVLPTPVNGRVSWPLVPGGPR